MRGLLLACLPVLFGCSDRHGADDGSGDEGDTSGGPTACDPSTPDIAPAVAVTVVNSTAQPLYFTEAESCSIGTPFAIALGEQRIDWLVESCVTCAAVIEGQCGCPAACAADSVIRIDPGGRYEGQWSGAVAFAATLTAGCASGDCGDQCTALAQAEAGEYTALATASGTVDCGAPVCDCNGTPDPGGWCSITGTRTGDDRVVEAMFAYPSATAVEVAFE